MKNIPYTVVGTIVHERREGENRFPLPLDSAVDQRGLTAQSTRQGVPSFEALISIRCSAVGESLD